jgi:hypothetical protein
VSSRPARWCAPTAASASTWDAAGITGGTTTGLDRPAFENSGDGGYLFDRRGDLRAYDIYPG